MNRKTAKLNFWRLAPRRPATSLPLNKALASPESRRNSNFLQKRYRIEFGIWGLKGRGKLEFVFSSGIGFSGDFSGSVSCTGY